MKGCWLNGLFFGWFGNLMLYAREAARAAQCLECLLPAAQQAAVAADLAYSPSMCGIQSVPSLFEPIDIFGAMHRVHGGPVFHSPGSFGCTSCMPCAVMSCNNDGNEQLRSSKPAFKPHRVLSPERSGEHNLPIDKSLLTRKDMAISYRARISRAYDRPCDHAGTSVFPGALSK